MHNKSIRYAAALFAAFSLAVLAGGCASTPKEAGPSEGLRVFYPLPPDPPRVQYLTAINTSWDVVPERGGLSAVVLGARDEDSRSDTLIQPYGVATYEGKIYVCDRRASAVKVFDLKNKAYGRLGGGMGLITEPTNLHIDADGYKYIVESMLGRIQVFDPQDKFVATYRLEGSRPADLVTVGSELFVTDVINNRILVLDRSTGKVLRELGSKGHEPGQFVMPNAITRDAEGDLYVNDQMNFRIQKIDRDGNPLMAAGRAGDSYGEFARPRGIAVGPDGIIYVVESVYEVVQMFNQEGKVLMAFGNYHGAPGFLELPAGITVDRSCLPYVQEYIDPSFDPDYLVIVISQVGDARIGIYAFGKLKPGAKMPAAVMPQAVTESAPSLDVRGMAVPDDDLLDDIPETEAAPQAAPPPAE